MKYRVKVSKKLGVKKFVIDGDKGAELVYAEAETLREGRLASFVPLTYEKRRRGKLYRLTYVAQGFIPLEDYLARALPPRALEKMLRSLLGALRDCEGSGLLRQRVVTDPDRILVNPASGQLRFIYVPLQSFVSTQASMRGALIYLCEHALVPPDEMALRDQVLDIARRMVVVTSTDLLAQLRELGIDRVPERAPEAGESFMVDTDQLGNRVYHGLDFLAAQRRAEEERAAAEAEARRRVQAMLPTGGWDLPGDPGTVTFAGWQMTRLATGEAWSLPDGVYEVGRDAQESICLPGVVGLSARHLRISVSGISCEIEDLGSTNGTRVNGMRLAPHAPHALQQGDQIKLGNELFQVM